MKLHVAVQRYRLPLVRPLATREGSLTAREGLILTLVDPDGYTGAGEVAPIAWIDSERLDAAAVELARLGDSVLIPDESLVDEAQRRAWLDRLAGELRPSVLAGLDAAVLDLCARRVGKSAAALLGASTCSPVPVAALVVESDPDKVAELVAARVAVGYSAIKLKVGSSEQSVDVARIIAARSALGGRGTLRLDANAAWSVDVAREVLGKAGAGDIDYIEEPLSVPTLASIAELRAATGVPIAIDESLDRLGGASVLMSPRRCDVVVLKPARIGGATRTVELGHRLSTAGIRVVLTDAIETAVGRAAVVHAAAALAGVGRPEPVGLGGLELMPREPASDGVEHHRNVISLVPSGPGLAVAAAQGQ